MSGPVTITESNWYDDSHVSFSGPPGAFTRARRIWKALVALPYVQQQRLLKWYEPRQFFPKEYKPIPEDVVRADHAAYYEARKGLRG